MVSQSSSAGHTIVGKTADLTDVQKTTMDTSHKEGETQKIIAKEAGCSPSSVSNKHINREGKGRNRDNCTLQRIAKQKRGGDSPGASRRFGAGVGPPCFLRSKINAAVYRDVLEHFMLPAVDQLYGDADLIFQQDLAPPRSAKATGTWFKDHGIPVLDWPANSEFYDSPQSRLHLALLTCLFLLLSALGLALYCTDRRRPQRACEELQTALAVYLLQFKQIVWACWIWLTMQ